MRTWSSIICAAPAALLLAIACSSSDDGTTSGSGSGASGGSAGGNAGGSGQRGGGGGGGQVGGSAGVINIGTDGGGVGEAGTADACAAASYQGEQIPLDMLIMFDQSGSMDEHAGNTTKWEAIKAALVDFVRSAESAGIGVGLSYFPLRVSCTPNNPDCDCPNGVCDPQEIASNCNANDYAVADVPIGLLPGVAQKIADSLTNHSPQGGTPTHPALEGAIQTARAHAAANPGRKTIVVLATDGAPNDCSSSVDNVAQVASTGVAQNPSIQTFVIGVGNTGNLNQIAQAGGTTTALIVSSTASAGQQFLDAMNRIRGQALGCEFTIPLPGAGQSVNLNQVNVRFTPPGAPSGAYILKVPDAAACNPNTGGWYYDNPTNPTQIRACPKSCELLKGGGGKVRIEVGCDSIPPPA